ncbi:hypothetical protein D5086_007815 [Populus alba]|uniref:Uncharacterized protein n=1 Tax=Populus alba TaxID=43335 RepID=A0ACC4CG44_POPAL
MSLLKLLMHLSPLLVAHLFVSGINSTYDPGPLFYVTPTIPTGFSLGEKDGKETTTSDDWAGRFWGRTHCTEDDTGRFSCITGDCGSGKIECSTVPAGSSPVTMAEFKINNAGLDFFNVSLLDGYNLPLLVLPSNKSCKKAGCVVDLNGVCPSELSVNSSDGRIAGCRSACEAVGSQQYCCTGDYATPSTCKPTSYSQNFKRKCPGAYTYPLDDETGTFSCESSDYQIVFCAVIFILRARWRGKSEQDQQDVEDDHIKHVPGMPVREILQASGF